MERRADKSRHQHYNSRRTPEKAKRDGHNGSQKHTISYILNDMGKMGGPTGSLREDSPPSSPDSSHSRTVVSSSRRTKGDRDHSSSRMKFHKCNECNDEFLTSVELEKHIHRQHKSKPFKCKDCPKSFGEKGNLNKKEKPWPCNQCGLTFAFRDTLNRHIAAVHEDLRPFTCDYCSAKFKKREHLQRHEQRCGQKVVGESRPRRR